MRLPHEAHRSSVYLNFKEINSQEFQSIVRFFEEYEDDIQRLTFEEQFEMLLTYVAALFEVGAYSNYISSCDYAIESVIYFNVKEYNGEDIYNKLLFRKAAAYYHLMEYKKSEKILRELTAMNPEHKLNIAFLKKCMRAQPSRKIRKTRSISVLLFLITAAVIAVEIIMIKSFFPEHLQWTQYIRNAIFGIGWLVLLGGAFYLRFSINESVQSYLKTVKQKNNIL